MLYNVKKIKCSLCSKEIPDNENIDVLVRLGKIAITQRIWIRLCSDCAESLSQSLHKPLPELV